MFVQSKTNNVLDLEKVQQRDLHNITLQNRHSAVSVYI